MVAKLNSKEEIDCFMCRPTIFDVIGLRQDFLYQVPAGQHDLISRDADRMSLRMLEGEPSSENYNAVNTTRLQKILRHCVRF